MLAKTNGITERRDYARLLWSSLGLVGRSAREFDAWASGPGAVQLVLSYGRPFDSWNEDKRRNVPTLVFHWDGLPINCRRFF
jgi:hypothetical protein